MRQRFLLPRTDAQQGTLRRNLIHILGIGSLTALLLASGASVTFALWNSQAQAGAVATGATLEVTTTFADLDFQFRNEVLSTTGTYTVTNTTSTDSAVPGTVTTQLSASGDSALASALSVSVWPQSGGSCATVPPSSVSGTWASIPAITDTVPAGDSITYCVRVTGSERGSMGSASGTLAINPTVSATLSVGNWTSGTVTASASQTTQAIFTAVPATSAPWVQIVNQATGQCVDVHGASADEGTGVIDFECKWGTNQGTYNQQWGFSASHTVNGAAYYDLTPRHNDDLRMDVVGASSNSLAEIDVRDDSLSRESQEWQLQSRAAGVFQLVNRNSGLCLTPRDSDSYTGTVEYAQLSCDGARQDQAFSTRVPFEVPTMDLDCQADGSEVKFVWGGSVPGNVHFAVAQTGGTATGLGSVAYSANSFPVAAGQVSGPDGEYLVSVTGGGESLAALPVWKTITSGQATLSCTEPPPPVTVADCTQGANGDYITLTWDTISEDQSELRLDLGFASPIASVTQSGSLSSATIHDEKVRLAPIGLHTAVLTLIAGGTDAAGLADLVVDITKSGDNNGNNNWNIWCTQ